MPLYERQVFWACAGVLAGVALADRPPTWLALFCLILATAGSLAWLAAGEDRAWFRRQAVPILLLILCALAGYARQKAVQLQHRRDPAAMLQAIDCTGEVTEPARVGAGKTRFRFRVQRVEGQPRVGPFPLLVLVRGPERFLPEVAPGEKWRLRGRLTGLEGSAYPGGFDARKWAAQRGIHHQLRISFGDCERLGPPEGWGFWPVACRVRIWLMDQLRPNLEPAQFGLVTGIMLGETGELSREVEEDYRALGLSHLLAASGMNVAVVALLVRWLGMRIGYSELRLAFPSIAAVWFYCALAGASPSIVRATWMASLTLLARGLGRRSDAWQTFLVTTLFLTLLDPAIWSDLGFQLSFAAVLGLLTYGSSLTFAPPTGPLAGPLNWLYRATSLTFAASFLVTPLLLGTFHQLPSLSLPANLLCAPLAEALLPLGFAGSVLTGLSTQLGAPLIGLLQLGLDLLISLPHFLASRFPGWQLPRPALTFWLLYGAAALLLLRPGRGRFGLVCLVAALISLTFQVGQRQDSLTIRHARLRQGTAVWMSVSGIHVLIGESERVSGPMLDMLHDQGVARADLLIGLDSLRLETRVLGPLKVVSQPDSLMIQYGRLQWCWRRNGSVRLEGARVELPHSSWDLEKNGPLELWSDGQVFRARAWSDQAISILTSNTRFQGSPTWSDPGGNPAWISLSRRTPNSAFTVSATEFPASFSAEVPRDGRTLAW